MDKAQSRVEFTDFGGMYSSLDAVDLPDGVAEVQINVGSLVIGELSTRRGYNMVQFEAE